VARKEIEKLVGR